MDNDGSIPLYHALKSNTNLLQIILNEVDRDDKATIDYLVELKSFW